MWEFPEQAGNGLIGKWRYGIGDSGDECSCREYYSFPLMLAVQKGETLVMSAATRISLLFFHIGFL